MSPETLSILHRHYGYAKGAEKRLGPPTKAELAAVRREGWAPGKVVRVKHDEAVRRLRAAVRSVDSKAILDGFVAGVGGSFVRGRQPLVSYAYAKNLETHSGEYDPGYSTCKVCGIEKVEENDPADDAVRWWGGAVWNEGPGNYFADLEEFARLEPPKATSADRSAFHALLRHVADAPEGCTPGQLEKSIASAKIVPESSKYARYGMLEALAEVGVLPNALISPSWDRFVTRTEVWAASRKVRGAPRSDIVLPFGAWRGGVDWKRAKSLFRVTR
jgi:hypothetical protein